jgi:hypothetical protein
MKPHNNHLPFLLAATLGCHSGCKEQILGLQFSAPSSGTANTVLAAFARLLFSSQLPLAVRLYFLPWVI